MGEADGAVRAANRAFYDAFEASDLAAMRRVWEVSYRVLCTHPGWATLRGLDDVMASWDGLFQGPQRLQFILTNEVVTVQEDVAWVTVDENLLAEGTTGAIAALNIFVLDGAVWRMVAHHGCPVAVAR